MSGIEDRLAIEQLVHRYAWASDSRDFATMATLFTDDAEVAVETVANGARDGARGAQAIADWVEQRHRSEFAAGHRRRHLTTCFVLHECDGERAAAGAYIQVVVSVRGGPPETTAFGTYDDTFRKVGGQWRFERRLIRIEGKRSAG